MKIGNILNMLDKAKKLSSGQYTARCPAHEDAHNSLSITEQDGKILLKCFTGCATEGIVSALGITVEDLFSDTDTPAPALKPKKTQRTEVGQTRYEIKDRSGTLVAEHVRTDYSDGSKKFSWYKDEQWNLGGMPVSSMPLYKVELLPDEGCEDVHVYVCEGEKAADALIENGYHAVGTVCGSSAIPDDNNLMHLLGWGKVSLWPDNDDVGRKHMEKIATKLKAMGIDVKIIAVPSAPTGGDAYDYFASKKV